LREEAGFTLSEMMVTMLVMLVVLFALYSIFDMSIRVFSFGNNKVEAVENARLGLEKMEREIRAAYPYDKGNASTPDMHLLDTMSGDEIAFSNDRNGSYVIEPGETIRYRLEDDDPSDGESVCNSGEMCRVTRSEGGGVFEPVVEFVEAPAGLEFTYLLAGGAVTTDETALEAVRIKLVVSVDEGTRDEGTQTLTTEVALRNRGS
jgi:prepilin-type N-terminal cleavage/methylation domain-containing protein